MNRPSRRCLHLPADRERHSAQQMTCHEDGAACIRHHVAVGLRHARSNIHQLRANHDVARVRGATSSVALGGVAVV